ncbi:hypothetical protein IFM89_025418 [Coptis chinensis]|uniref:Uncharacterized protein n=1 Tax=Coptis chinensis TaxID=261450 RepID=A0A835GXU3_9MAGN|nr:hypothetical protein IFM89_025418 [Coptis chinensis]
MWWKSVVAKSENGGNRKGGGGTVASAARSNGGGGGSVGPMMVVAMSGGVGVARVGERVVDDVKLAGVAISLHLRLRSADMPVTMQEHALRYTRSLVDDQARKTSRPNPTHIARALKKGRVLDRL